MGIEELSIGDSVRVVNIIFPKGIDGIIQSIDYLNGVIEARVSDDMYVVTLIENIILKGE